MLKKRLLKSRLSKLSSRSQISRTNALHALSLMRREKVSLAEACRLEHVKPATLLRHVGSALRQDKPGGRYRATTSDRFRRDVQIPTALGRMRVSVAGSKAATEIADYQNAVALYLRKGDASKLERFKGKTVGIRGNKVELMTDPTALTSLALAGALQFDQLYASFTRA
jgi:hypothetical protein